MKFFFNLALEEINLCFIDLSVYPCSIQFHPDYPKLVTTTTTTQQQQQQHLPQPCQHQWDAHRKTWERRERERTSFYGLYKEWFLGGTGKWHLKNYCVYENLSHLVIVKFSFTIS